MNARARTLAAINHQVPDRIPLDCIHVEIQEELAAFLGIPVNTVLASLGIDGRIVAPAYLGALPPASEGAPVNEWGSAHTQEYSGVGGYPLSHVSSVREIEDYRWPDPTQYDYTGAAAASQSLGNDYAVRGPYWLPLFDRACELLGMEEAMVWMHTQPLLFDAVLDQIFERTAEVCRNLLNACGEAMPILCLGDDFASQRGLMISPECWGRFLKRRYAALFQIGKTRGKHVWFHSCGDITAVLPDLLDIGIEVWETVQLHTLPLSAQQLKAEYGRHLTFFGGINTQRLPFATPTEVRAETLRCIEMLGRDGGYICGPDHHVKPDVPPRNALALFDTARSFRREGYTRGE
ncbi:MAG: uroporphyrinogen decarboxylase family protein [Anaerolineae bacterium]